MQMERDTAYGLWSLWGIGAIHGPESSLAVRVTAVLWSGQVCFTLEHALSNMLLCRGCGNADGARHSIWADADLGSGGRIWGTEQQGCQDHSAGVHWDQHPALHVHPAAEKER